MTDKSGGPAYPFTPNQQMKLPDGTWDQDTEFGEPGMSARLVIATKLAAAWVAGDAKREIIPGTVFDTAEALIAEEKRRVKQDADRFSGEPDEGDAVNDG